MDLADIGYHTVASDSTGSGQGQVMRCCENDNEQPPRRVPVSGLP